MSVFMSKKRAAARRTAEAGAGEEQPQGGTPALDLAAFANLNKAKMQAALTEAGIAFDPEANKAQLIDIANASAAG